MTRAAPGEGMMAVVRNRRAMITGVEAFDAEDAGPPSRPWPPDVGTPIRAVDESVT